MANININSPGAFTDDIALAMGKILNAPINIKAYGAVGDGTTDDSAAIAAAINAANAFAWAINPGQIPLVYAPAGTYRIVSTAIPIFTANGGIVGDGMNKTYFVVDKTYSGDVFSWSEAWSFTSFNDTQHVTGSVEEIYCGPVARDFSIFGDQDTTNNQVALGLYDRTDYVQFENIFVGWMRRGLYIGAAKVQIQSYNRESHYRNLKFSECGTTTLPAVEITTTGGGDGTNQLCFYDLNIYGPKSVGLRIAGNPSANAAARLIRFYGLRIEGYTRDGDLLQIGDTTSATGYCRDIYIYGLIIIGVKTGFAGVRITAQNITYHSFLIGIHGGQVTGAGQGIAVDYGRGIAIELDNLATTQTNVAVGANISGPIYLNGYGGEAFWTVTTPGGSQAALLRYATTQQGEYSKTYDPPSLTNGSSDTTTITASGARVYDFVVASFSNSLQGIILFAWVSVNDTISVRFQNNTGGTIDLASGTLRVKVIKSFA